MAPVHQAVLVAGSRLADQGDMFCTSLLQSKELRLHRNIPLTLQCMHRQGVPQCICLCSCCVRSGARLVDAKGMPTS